MSELIKTTVHGSFRNGGDGSASISWFLELEHAEYDQENLYEGWGEECIESIETFEGSDCHQEAVRNSEEQATERLEPQEAEEK